MLGEPPLQRFLEGGLQQKLAVSALSTRVTHHHHGVRLVVSRVLYVPQEQSCVQAN